MEGTATGTAPQTDINVGASTSAATEPRTGVNVGASTSAEGQGDRQPARVRQPIVGPTGRNQPRNRHHRQLPEDEQVSTIPK